MSKQSIDERRQFLLRQRLVLEVAGKQQVHAVGCELINRLLRREIDAIEVINPTVTAIRREQRLLDFVEVHARGQRAVNRMPLRDASKKRTRTRTADDRFDRHNKFVLNNRSG